MRNPTRRNRNIGTENQGYGQNNKLTISTPYGDTKIFHERLKDYSKEKRIINNHEFVFVVEKTRKNSIHCCSINDIEKIIKQIPITDYGDLKFIILRQPKRKEEILSPVWGRLSYYYEFESENYPAIILDAINLMGKLKWSKKLKLDDQHELERLKKDGHAFEESKRDYFVNLEFTSSRNTQLYRTLLHEFGHYVHYLEVVERPETTNEEFEEWEKRYEQYFKIRKEDKEIFAHKYSDNLKQKLLKNKIIPFDPQ